MAIDPYGSTATSVTSTSGASSSLNQLGEDYESFLTLLTAQIQNQDPLEPMDSTTFISQLAQLSQVEQSVATNENLEGLSTQLASMGTVLGSSLIGRAVVAPSEQLTLEGGEALLHYRLGAEASEVTIGLYAEDGTLVRELAGEGLTPGRRHAVRWDGLDAEGLAVPDATFRIEVTARDAAGEEISSLPYTTSEVLGMSLSQGLVLLELASGEQVLAGAVEEIATP